MKARPLQIHFASWHRQTKDTCEENMGKIRLDQTKVKPAVNHQPGYHDTKLVHTKLGRFKFISDLTPPTDSHMRENYGKNTVGPNEFIDFSNLRPAVNRQPGYRRVDSQSGSSNRSKMMSGNIIYRQISRRFRKIKNFEVMARTVPTAPWQVKIRVRS